MADPGSEPDSYAQKHPTRAAAAAAKEKFHRYARRLSDTDPEVDLDVWDSPLSQQAPEVDPEMDQTGAADEVVVNDPDSVPNTPDVDAQIALDDANGALQEYQRDPSDPTNFQRLLNACRFAVLAFAKYSNDSQAALIDDTVVRRGHQLFQALAQHGDVAIREACATAVATAVQRSDASAVEIATTIAHRTEEQANEYAQQLVQASSADLQAQIAQARDREQSLLDGLQRVMSIYQQGQVADREQMQWLAQHVADHQRRMGEALSSQLAQLNAGTDAKIAAMRGTIVAYATIEAQKTAQLLRNEAALADAAAAQRDVDAINAADENLRASEQRAIRRAEQLEARLRETNKELAEVKNKLADAHQAFSVHESVMQRHEASAKLQAETVDKLRDEIASLRRELTSVQHQHAITVTKEQLEQRLVKEREVLADTRRALENHVDRLFTSTHAAPDARQNSGNSVLQAQIADIRAAVASLEARPPAVERADIESLRAQLNNVRNEMHAHGSAERDAKRALDELALATAQLAKLRVDVDKQRTDFGATTAKATAAYDSVQGLSTDVQAIKHTATLGRSGANDLDLKKLQTQLEQLKVAMGNIVGDLHKKVDEQDVDEKIKAAKRFVTEHVATSLARAPPQPSTNDGSFDDEGDGAAAAEATSDKTGHAQWVVLYSVKSDSFTNADGSKTMISVDAEPAKAALSQLRTDLMGVSNGKVRSGAINKLSHVEDALMTFKGNAVQKHRRVYIDTVIDANRAYDYAMKNENKVDDAVWLGAKAAYVDKALKDIIKSGKPAEISLTARDYELICLQAMRDHTAAEAVKVAEAAKSKPKPKPGGKQQHHGSKQKPKAKASKKEDGDSSGNDEDAD